MKNSLSALFLALLLAAPVRADVTISVDDADWNWSPYNWRFSGSTYAESNTPGAYAEIGFTGTSVDLLVDVTPLSDQSYAAGKYPYIRTTVDGSPTDTQLASGNTSLTLATGLSAGSHTLRVDFVFQDSSSTDRWTTPSNVLRITGISIDDAADSEAATPAGKVAVWYGDSISEAVWVSGYATGSSLTTLVPSVAAGLGCEIGRIAYQSQGLTAAASVGNVPSVENAWDFYSDGNSRLVGGLLSPAPDYVFLNHGTNDSGASDATVYAAVESWLDDVRAAAPDAQIFVVVASTQTKASAYTTGVSNYLTSNPSDGRVYLVDTGTSSYATLEGTHPTAAGHDAYFADVWPLVSRLAPRNRIVPGSDATLSPSGTATLQP